MRKNLKQFDEECLKELKAKVLQRYGRKSVICRNTYSFWRELESILEKKSKDYEWDQKPKDGIVLGEVHECTIGEYNHMRRLHRFAWLYAEYDANQEVVIDWHDHKEPCNKGTQTKKVKEWYVFPDGHIEYCRKDAKHRLVNNYHEPIYVLSIKVMSNAV